MDLNLIHVCKPGAILAQNVDATAAKVSRPADVINLFIFLPSNIKDPPETKAPSQVNADAVATAFGLAKRLPQDSCRFGAIDHELGDKDGKTRARYRARLELRP